MTNTQEMNRQKKDMLANINNVVGIVETLENYVNQQMALHNGLVTKLKEFNIIPDETPDADK